MLRWPRGHLDRKWRRLGRRCSQKVLEHRRSHFSASSPQLLRVCGNAVYALPQSVCALPRPGYPPTHNPRPTAHTQHNPSTVRQAASERPAPPCVSETLFGPRHSPKTRRSASRLPRARKRRPRLPAPVWRLSGHHLLRRGARARSAARSCSARGSAPATQRCGMRTAPSTASRVAGHPHTLSASRAQSRR